MLLFHKVLFQNSHTLYNSFANKVNRNNHKCKKNDCNPVIHCQRAGAKHFSSELNDDNLNDCYHRHNQNKIPVFGNMLKQVHAFGSCIQTVPNNGHDECREHESSDIEHLGASNNIVNYSKDVLKDRKADHRDKYTSYKDFTLKIGVEDVCRT